MESTSSADSPPQVDFDTRASEISATPASPALTIPARSVAMSSALRTSGSPRGPSELETIWLTTVVLIP